MSFGGGGGVVVVFFFFFFFFFFLGMIVYCFYGEKVRQKAKK